jgi:predicted RNase H-like HicB family nuclease
MTTLVFTAIARGAQGAGYNATFPDLPGLSVSGSDIAELLTRARETLRADLQRRTDEGLDWPTATPLEQIAAEPGAIPFMVDIAVEDPAVRVNISIGERLLKRIDTAAEAAGMSRSGFIAAAARSALGERSGKAYDIDAVAKTLQEEWGQLGRKLTETLGPNSSFTRNLADLDNKVTESIRKAAEGVSSAMTRRMDAERTEASASAAASASASAGEPRHSPADPVT